MKRLTCFVLAAVAIFSLSACNQSNVDFENPVNFYYIYPTEQISFNSSEGVIGYEIREAKSFVDNLQKLLDIYLKGPESNTMQSPFPANVHIDTIELQDNVLLITLSPEFTKLTGLDLTIACACLSMTVLELVECDAVKINVFDELLDGNNSITMTRESILLLDAASLLEDVS